MAYPLIFQVGPLHVQAHLVFECLAYFLGFRTFMFLRSRWADPVPESTRFMVLAAAAVGAVIGSRVLSWIDHPSEFWSHRYDLLWLVHGKTVVGALLGGLVAVETAKRILGEKRSTGDLFVIPLCIGIAVGRIGCFLGGLPDQTYGEATTLPWGVDFGDGVSRHPVQLYEIAAVLGMAGWAWWVRHRPSSLVRTGDLFRGFMVMYLGFRFAVDVLKPEQRPYAGLSGIQIACLAGLLYYARDLPRLWRSTWKPFPRTLTRLEDHV